MNIYAVRGTKVVFDGVESHHSINWGGNTDPNRLLKVGQQYTIDHTEVHNMHTKVFLVEVPGKFNSVWFTEV